MAYAGCTIGVTGGTPPYTFSISVTSNNPPLPEGMSINTSTGVVSSALIGGQERTVRSLSSTMPRTHRRAPR